MNQSLHDILHGLINANHILHYHKVVDAFGHISVRNPLNSKTYIMSNSIAPALVEAPRDLIEYHVADSSPVNPGSGDGYLERFIHGEIYKRFRDVNCVIHSHSEAVIPYTIGNVPLVPMYHMAGFLGTKVPNFDIAKLYTSFPDEDIEENMLVSKPEYGAALAGEFDDPSHNSAGDWPKYSVVLMAKHGFTAVGPSIQSAVFRAVYTQTNAGIQTTTMMLNGAMAATSNGRGEGTIGLSVMEAQDCAIFGEGVVGRPWGLWVREVERCGLYINELGQGPR